MLSTIDGRDSAAPVHIPRPVAVGAEPLEAVRSIVDEVRASGDVAVARFTERFDNATVAPGDLRVPEETILKARSLVRPELIDAFEVMIERLRRTCERQATDGWIEREGDSFSGEMVRPLRRVGIYAPGGRAAYPSSVIMAAVPAQVAGVEGLAVASPPGPRGEIAESVLAACAVAGITEVYRMGGAQSIAALAYGTDTVRPVEKIVGPGNIYVTLAKRLVQGYVGVDTEAGPSEIAIVADGSADPEWLALDIIAQAEHGPLGSHVLITWSEALADDVIAALDKHVLMHRKAEDIENHLTEGGAAVLVNDLDHALDTVNAFAPEHLELVFEGAEESLDRIHNAGSVFVGPYSPVPVGDYVGGTNHVLPTGGTARYASGLGVGDFVKRIYVSGYGPDSLRRLAPHIDSLAEAEGLLGHARSVWERLEPEV